MKTKIRVILTTVLFAALGFLLQPQAPLGGLLWPQSDLEAHYGAPAAPTLAALMAYSAVSSLAFGLAVAFLVHGRPLVSRLPVRPGLATAAHLAIVWLLGSWVPHDSLHQHITSMGALAGLEWGFHFTLIICGVILAGTFVSIATAAPRAGLEARPEAAPSVPLTAAFPRRP